MEDDDYYVAWLALRYVVGTGLFCRFGFGTAMPLVHYNNPRMPNNFAVTIMISAVLLCYS